MHDRATKALRRDILLTVAFLIAALSVAELGFRAVLPNLSANSRTLAAAPERADRIVAHDGTTVLVLGNSISGEGIDPGGLASGLNAHGIDALVEHQAADSTVMRDWYYELENLFIADGAVPDWVVLPVGDSFPLTRVNARTEDLMFSFLRWSDLVDFRRRAAVDGFEDVCGLILSKASALYGFRGRFQKRVLVAIAADYDRLRFAMSDAGARVTAENETTADPQWATLFAELTSRLGIRVAVVAMPTEPLESVLPAADRELAIGFGWAVLEPGRGHVWRESDRPDGLHLEPDARRRLTELLARELAQLIGGGAGASVP